MKEMVIVVTTDDEVVVPEMDVVDGSLDAVLRIIEQKEGYPYLEACAI